MTANQCPKCRAAATEDAFSNWLDAHGLRAPHPEHKGSYVVLRELTEAEEAEVAQWAEALMDNADDYWHGSHVED